MPKPVLLQRPPAAFASRQTWRQLPPDWESRVLLALRWLFFVLSLGTLLLALVQGEPRLAVPMAALAIAMNPFVELPPLLWMALIAFVLALS